MSARRRDCRERARTVGDGVRSNLNLVAERHAGSNLVPGTAAGDLHRYATDRREGARGLLCASAPLGVWILGCVDIDGFWWVVESARVAAGSDADRARTDGRSSVVAGALVAELVRLPGADIIAFDDLFSEVRAQADLWNGCAACWIIEHGFLSDDGFSDFRAGLVALGRSAFEAAVNDFDSLARHPAVREISASLGTDLWIGDERLLSAAPSAYEQLTGDADAFWDASEAAGTNAAQPTETAKPADERWDLRSEAEWSSRLPALRKLFAARFQPN